MARPERNNVDYFPFLCKEGTAMFYIEQKYGNDGFASWIKILRQLAVTNHHYLNLNNKAEFMLLSSKCRVSESVLNEIINDLCELGEFDKELWSNKIVWCQKFIDSIQDAYNKRNNKCITLDGLRLLLISLGVLKQSKLPPKEPDKPQSKEEYSKEDKTIPTWDVFLAYCLTKKPLVDEDHLKLKYTSWIENKWCVIRDNKNIEIKNWKTTILNTLPYIKDKEVKKEAPKQMYTYFNSNGDTNIKK